MRYIKQHDDINCGPIALMNVHKWQGKRVTYKDLPRYVKLCKRLPRDGTPVSCFSRACNSAPFKGNYAKLASWLEGCAAVICNRRHYYLVLAPVTVGGQRHYKVANYAPGVETVPWQTIKADCKHFYWLFI